MSASPSQPSASHTVLFDWDLTQFDRLVENSAFDDSLNLGLPYLPRTGCILEAGSGPGHVVAYLAAQGYDIEGVELNAAVVDAISRLRPALRVRVGDIGEMDVPAGFYTGLLSFGVIEHFKSGPAGPLAEHYRVLAPGGIAIISVPSLTLLRRAKRAWYLVTAPLRPSLWNWLRRLTGRPAVRFNLRGRDGFLYRVNPLRGEFFEYVLSPDEFEREVRAAGFTIMRSEPTHHDVALWCDLGDWAARNHNRLFIPTAIGRALHAVLRPWRFGHNHMHTIVARR